MDQGRSDEYQLDVMFDAALSALRTHPHVKVNVNVQRIFQQERALRAVLAAALQLISNPASEPAPTQLRNTVRSARWFIAAEVLFDVLLEPLIDYCRGRFSEVSVARGLHHAVWQWEPSTSWPAHSTTSVAAPRPALTSREVEVLALVGEALTNRQIAVEMRLSTSTVKRHLANVAQKLGSVSRLDAVRHAKLYGYL